MSAHACIGVKGESCIRWVYLHWDGYLDWAGNILLKHYNSFEQAKELVMLGDLSSLRSRVKPDKNENHSFDDPAEDVTVAYHRDRNEPRRVGMLRLRQSTKDSDIIQELCRATFGNYVYLFDKEGNRWLFGTDSELLTRESEVHPAAPGVFYPLEFWKNTM